MKRNAPMITTTLGRYFAGKFIATVLAVFTGVYLLVLVVDFIELSRRLSDAASATTPVIALTSFYHVPQIIERLTPFGILVAAMVSFLALSRRLELVVARAAGISAWQFISPALVSALVIGALATTAYNPFSATAQERASRMEAQLFGDRSRSLQNASGYWINQITSEGQAILNAANSQSQGTRLAGLTIFRLDTSNRFLERIEATEATLEDGYWRLKNVRHYRLNEQVFVEDTFLLKTSLTREQVRESFVQPDAVSFWQLPEYIASSINAGTATSGYRYQYHKLLAQPFMLIAMVMLASAVSLRFFRLGGVQIMVLSGVGAGFLLYVLSKVTEDLAKAEVMHPIAAAWLPICMGGLAGFLALLYQEDG